MQKKNASDFRLVCVPKYGSHVSSLAMQNVREKLVVAYEMVDSKKIADLIACAMSEMHLWIEPMREIEEQEKGMEQEDMWFLYDVLKQCARYKGYTLTKKEE